MTGQLYEEECLYLVIHLEFEGRSRLKEEGRYSLLWTPVESTPLDLVSGFLAITGDPNWI